MAQSGRKNQSILVTKHSLPTTTTNPAISRIMLTHKHMEVINREFQFDNPNIFHHPKHFLLRASLILPLNILKGLCSKDIPRFLNL